MGGVKTVVGIADLPGFYESLRLLIEREEYSVSDIAMMFGVSRQRIQQLIARLGVPCDYRTGPMRGARAAVRVWDDDRNVFRPVSRGNFSRQKRKAKVLNNRDRRTTARQERRANIKAMMRDLVNSLGRSPTWGEMWVALGGDPEAKSSAACARVLARWPGGGRGSRERIADFRSATGLVARPRGPLGHVKQ